MQRTKLSKTTRRLRFGSALLLAGLVATSAGVTSATELNKIVLRVNDEIFTSYDFAKRKESEMTAVLSNPNLSPSERQEAIAKVSKDVARQVFREMLLESYARQNGITVSERDVDDSVRRIQEQQGIASTQELLKALESVGMSLEQLRSNLRQEMLLSTVVRREVTGKIEVSDDEKRAYYRNHPEEFLIAEERKLKEVIFLEESGLGTEGLLAAAQSLHKSLMDGGAFEDEVAIYQDQGLATGVIDLGWVKAGDLEEALGEAAFAAPVGGYSQPVQAKGGFHIVFTEELKDGYVQPFTEVEPIIDARERNRRFGPELRKFMAGLESSSFIVENLPSEAVGFRSVADDYDPEAELRDFRAPLTKAAQDAEASGEEAPSDEDPVDGELSDEDVSDEDMSSDS